MKVYNTLTRTKEEFVPITGNKVGVYSCGPTIYWNQHIGNMYAFMSWDILVRTLRYLGYDVTWMMNMTDVGHMTSDQDAGEDKMEKGAKREGVTPWELAAKYKAQFLDSLRLMNIITPDFLWGATEHIPEQIALAKKIEDNGFAYQTKIGLVFDTAKFADYANFANLKLDEMEAGARLEVDPEKKNPGDFLLWVTSQPDHVMKWDSPWGEGFPGWHLECTAMSSAKLGEYFDIHTGGIEHIGVHHTNEIAQGFGAFGHNTAKYWMHNAWLLMKDGKMSKSLGNVYTMQDFVALGYDPLAFRYLVLTSHYRKGLTFSIDSLKAAQVALNKLRKLRPVQNPSVSNPSSSDKSESTSLDREASKKYLEEFKGLIGDDLAMPEVIALVWKVAKSDLSADEKWSVLLEMDKVLGLDLNREEIEEEAPQEIIDLNTKRQEAREAKNWTEADRLREEIKKLGYVVEDSQNSCTITKLQ